MKPEIIVALVAAFTSSGVMSLIVFLIQRRDKKIADKKADESSQTRMVIALGHDKIVYLTDKFVKRGAITLKEKRNLEYLVSPYFDGGGNGDAKIGYEACERLQVVSDDDAEALDAEIKRREYGLDDDE